MFNFFSSGTKTTEPAPADPSTLTASSQADENAPTKSVVDNVDSTTGISSHTPSASPSGSRFTEAQDFERHASAKDALKPAPSSVTHLGSPATSDHAHLASSSAAAAPDRIHNSSTSTSAVLTKNGHPGASLASPLDSMSGIGSALPPTNGTAGPLDSRQTAQGSNTVGGAQTLSDRHVDHKSPIDQSHPASEINPLHAVAVTKGKSSEISKAHQDSGTSDSSPKAGGIDSHRSPTSTSTHNKHEASKVSNSKAALDPTTGQGAHVGHVHPSDRIELTETERARLEADKKEHAPGSAAPETAAHPSGHKPTFVEKAKGTIEVVVGKVTHNEALIAEGTALKTGHAHPTPQTY